MKEEVKYVVVSDGSYVGIEEQISTRYFDETIWISCWHNKKAKEKAEKRLQSMSQEQLKKVFDQEYTDEKELLEMFADFCKNQGPAPAGQFFERKLRQLGIFGRWQ